MMKKIIPYIIITLIIINILISLYIYYPIFDDGKGFCLTGESCLKVQGSKYGYIFGFPVSLFGVIGFSLLLYVYIKSFKNDRYKLYFKILSLIGVLFSLYFISIQFFVLDMLCSLCLIVDSSTIIIFLLALIRR